MLHMWWSSEAMIVLSIFAILWCCAYGYTLTQPGFESKWIHLSYQKMYRGEIWRMFTASFFHIDVVHLLYDLIILFSLSTMENNKGSIFFHRSVLSNISDNYYFTGDGLSHIDQRFTSYYTNTKLDMLNGFFLSPYRFVNSTIFLCQHNCIYIISWFTN